MIVNPFWFYQTFRIYTNIDKVSKEIRFDSKHLFYMNIGSFHELQKTAYIHSANADFQGCIKKIIDITYMSFIPI